MDGSHPSSSYSPPPPPPPLPIRNPGNGKTMRVPCSLLRVGSLSLFLHVVCLRHRITSTVNLLSLSTRADISSLPLSQVPAPPSTDIPSFGLGLLATVDSRSLSFVCLQRLSSMADKRQLRCRDTHTHNVGLLQLNLTTRLHVSTEKRKKRVKSSRRRRSKEFLCVSLKSRELATGFLFQLGAFFYFSSSQQHSHKRLPFQSSSS